MKLHTLGSMFLLLFACACSVPKQTYEVTVMNIGNKPLSVGMVKNGGPTQEGWDAPEQIAIHAPQHSQRKWGTMVKPGQTLTLGPQTGRFREGIVAILRVYIGDLPIEDLIAYNRSDRLDIHLMPGRSGIVVNIEEGKLKAEPLERGVGGVAPRSN